MRGSRLSGRAASGPLPPFCRRLPVLALFSQSFSGLVLLFQPQGAFGTLIHSSSFAAGQISPSLPPPSPPAPFPSPTPSPPPPRHTNDPHVLTFLALISTTLPTTVYAFYDPPYNTPCLARPFLQTPPAMVRSLLSRSADAPARPAKDTEASVMDLSPTPEGIWHAPTS